MPLRTMIVGAPRRVNTELVNDCQRGIYSDLECTSVQDDGRIIVCAVEQIYYRNTSPNIQPGN